MPNELKFNIRYRVPVKIMYETFTNPNELSKFTQTKAEFDKKVGGAFNLYDGFITGTNEELVENQKLVQKWKFNNWKDSGDLILLFKEKEGSECLINVWLKNIPERDTFGQFVDLKVLENGFRSQIFEKIAKFMGYPLNRDEDESDEDDD